METTIVDIIKDNLIGRRIRFEWFEEIVEGCLEDLRIGSVPEGCLVQLTINNEIYDITFYDKIEVIV